jgi:hypothetical protein
MTKVFNRARMTTSTTGTGTITLDSAVAGFATFAEAGVSDGDEVAYTITEGNDYENGVGTYTASGTTLSRDTVRDSKIGGSHGTSKMNLGGGAEVFISPHAEDVVTPSSTNTLTNKTFDANGIGNSLSNVEVADLASSAKTGSDTTVVTGTASNDGDLLKWNADGDAVASNVFEDGSGNIGIGATSLSEKLEVDGNILAKNAGIFRTVGANDAFKAEGSSGGSGAFGPASFSGGASFRVSNGADSLAFFTIDAPDISSSGGQIQYRLGRATTQGSGEDSSLMMFAHDGSATFTIRLRSSGDANFAGAVSKGSGSFRIHHPLPDLSDTHWLVHSFVESPTADNIYRGRATLQSGQATVDLDAAANMTPGTWAALNGNAQVWVQNETGWEPVHGSVAGSTLTIECKDATSTDTVSWLVIGERQDQHMLDTQWTDEFGRVIVEREKTYEEIHGAPEE